MSYERATCWRVTFTDGSTATLTSAEPINRATAAGRAAEQYGKPVLLAVKVFAR